MDTHGPAITPRFYHRNRLRAAAGQLKSITHHVGRAGRRWRWQRYSRDRRSISCSLLIDTAQFTLNEIHQVWGRWIGCVIFLTSRRRSIEKAALGQYTIRYAFENAHRRVFAVRPTIDQSMVINIGRRKCHHQTPSAQQQDTISRTARDLRLAGDPVNQWIGQDSSR